MLRLLEFAGLPTAIVVGGLTGVRHLHRRLRRNAKPRPPTAPMCRGLGPLTVTSISARDDEVLVRLDRAAASRPPTTEYVVCRTTSTHEQQLLTRWQRRRTLVWLQQDMTNEVVIFAGQKRVVLELWTESRGCVR